MENIIQAHSFWFQIPIGIVPKKIVTGKNIFGISFNTALSKTFTYFSLLIINIYFVVLKEPKEFSWGQILWIRISW